jgi:hypothetical protein
MRRRATIVTSRSAASARTVSPAALPAPPTPDTRATRTAGTSGPTPTWCSVLATRPAESRSVIQSA